jgi:queuine tRNA-ribosyltransferase
MRHLFKSKELLALQLASIHNLAFYLYIVTEARNHIAMGDFNNWKNEQIPLLKTRL